MSVSAEQLKEVAQQLFNTIDVDGNGSLDKDEVRNFSQALVKQFKPDAEHNEEKFSENFDALDKDGNGKVSFEELYKVMVVKATEHGVLSE